MSDSRTREPKCVSFWNFLLGWLSRTSRMHQFDGSSLLHWQQPDLRMALKDAQVRLHLLCTKATYKEDVQVSREQSKGSSALLHPHVSLCHTSFTVQEDKIDYEEMMNFWGFFAIFFYNFRILHL